MSVQNYNDLDCYVLPRCIESGRPSNTMIINLRGILLSVPQHTSVCVHMEVVML